MRLGEKITRQKQEELLGLVPVERYESEEASLLNKDGDLWDEISQRFEEELTHIRQQAHNREISSDEAGRLFADVYDRINQAFQKAKEH